MRCRGDGGGNRCQTPRHIQPDRQTDCVDERTNSLETLCVFLTRSKISERLPSLTIIACLLACLLGGNPKSFGGDGGVVAL